MDMILLLESGLMIMQFTKKKFQSQLIKILLVSILLISPTWAIKALQVNIDEHTNKTIFNIELNQKPKKIKKFSLNNPARIVIDIPNLDWNVRNKILPKGLIKRVRYGRNKQNGRIVLDLTKDDILSKYNIYPHPKSNNHYFLTLDLSHQSTKNLSINNKSHFKKVVKKTEMNKFFSDHQLQPLKRHHENEIIIVVDAGHGGNDPGAISVSGYKEKNIVLSFAKEFANAINRERNMRAVLTRDKDFFIPLAERPMIAEYYQADIFISIHADSLEDHSFHGSTIYTLSDTASDAVAAQIADNENKSDVIAGVNFKEQAPEIADILIDFMRRETDISSFEFAENIVKNLKKTTNLVPNPHRRAGFKVLKSPTIPSVLIELGYLTNIKDERRLTNPEKRRKMINGIIKSIKNWDYQRQLAGH